MGSLSKKVVTSIMVLMISMPLIKWLFDYDIDVWSIIKVIFPYFILLLIISILINIWVESDQF